jgi:hypothetical protein
LGNTWDRPLKARRWSNFSEDKSFSKIQEADAQSAVSE